MNYPDPIEPVPPPSRPAPASSGEHAAACVLMLSHPGALTMADALLELRRRVSTLVDPTTPTALEELTRQIPVLEGLFHKFAADALATSNPEAKTRLLRAALNAQQAHARSFALVRGLALLAQGTAAVTLTPNSGSRPDNGSGWPRVGAH